MVLQTTTSMREAGGGGGGAEVKPVNYGNNWGTDPPSVFKVIRGTGEIKYFVFLQTNNLELAMVCQELYFYKTI